MRQVATSRLHRRVPIRQPTRRAITYIVVRIGVNRRPVTRVAIDGYRCQGELAVVKTAGANGPGEKG